MSEVRKLFLFIIAAVLFIGFLGFLVKGGLPENFLKTKEKTPTAKIGATQIPLLLAQTLDERLQGLSGRESLNENQGMLFVFEQKDIQPSFWMKEMRFGIDFLWINDGKIVEINENISPEPGKSDNELTLYTPAEAIDYVLEVNAGFSQRHNLKVGDTVEINL